MRFKFIDPLDADYDAEKMLRWEVLAKPFGLPPSSELTPQDKNSLHLVAVEKKKVVGCVCFVPQGSGQGELFHMAVSQDYRGKGFGRQLIHAMEEALCQKGFRDLYVYAPLDVEGFYAKLGYSSEGAHVKKNGIECQLMRKNL